MNDFVLFGGTAHPELATSIAHVLGVRLGACQVERFPDGELSVQLLESVRGKEVFVVQPTSPPVNDHLVELLAWADVCRRSTAARVTAIVPYFGYARADKRNCRREPITASMVATLMQAAGIDHVLTLDLHTPQVEGFFRIPVNMLTAVPTLCDKLRERLPEGTVVLSPDAGRVRLATAYAERLCALGARRRLTLLSVMFHRFNVRVTLEVECWLTWLVMTPRLHGIHHSIVREEQDSNWSSGLTLWDRIHGTYRANVPQNEITVGVPALREPGDVTLSRMLTKPLVEGPAPWCLSDSTEPKHGALAGPPSRLPNERGVGP